MAEKGRWDPPFQLPNVPIHTHVLPDGSLLFWGRRDKPDGSMDEHVCTPIVWDPETGVTRPTSQPKLGDVAGTTVNLFCSGHSFDGAGRLLVAGGHILDSHGDNQACIYDWRVGAWQALPPMAKGRWYPSMITLPDGSVLVMSGNFFDGVRETPNNDVPQIWDGQGWRSLTPHEKPPSLYPRLHVAPDGRVFVVGTNAESYLLDTSGDGIWTPAPGRAMGSRDYAPSVMFEPGKIIYIGGGNDRDTQLPTDAVEQIDLNVAAPVWSMAAPMNFKRRQHNATLLPDGSVLVTGGSQGSGFNDDTPGGPVHEAEIWSPSTGRWTVLASEIFDRLYHSTATLLPDATVLSAGGGEGAGAYAHRNGQIYCPPYLFRGSRPLIEAAPAAVSYATEFQVRVAGPVASLRWISLPSVTHAFNQNQRSNVLSFKADGSDLTVTAPSSPLTCQPGYYMLFALSAEGVPSKAAFVRIGVAETRYDTAIPTAASARPDPGSHNQIRPERSIADFPAHAGGIRVTVGLTSTCPYGLGACWGGAYEALTALEGVAYVHKVPSAEHSTAQLLFTSADLSALGRWPAQFARSANGSYAFRGIEAILEGTLSKDEEDLEILVRSDPALYVSIAALGVDDKVQWDAAAQRSKMPTDEEFGSYSALQTAWANSTAKAARYRVTGPLARSDGHWVLRLRRFELVASKPE